MPRSAKTKTKTAGGQGLIPIGPVRTNLRELAIERRAVAELRANPKNARTHSPSQLDLLANSIAAFGFTNPILIGADDLVIAGHGRLEAARQLGMSDVPTVCLSHLSPDEQRAYALADNRLAELAGWDLDLLQLELKEIELALPELRLETLGWEGAELDGLLFPEPDEPQTEPAIPEVQGEAVSRAGDLWALGPHRLCCGDACDPTAYAALMAGEKARMAFTDQPYNVPVEGHVRRRNGGHREFVAASGEMSDEDFAALLLASLTAIAANLMPGAIAFACMDWRHIGALLTAGETAGLELLNLIVWAKPVAGLGQFYRSQHELVAVFKVKGAPHLNTFGMGKGPARSNVWRYPGVSGFKRGRRTELDLHPTVKPSAMVADAIKDVSRRGELVLDPFGGSGSTLIGAEKTGRRARLIELDPLYCDVICRRWAAFSGEPAILVETGEPFAVVQARRATQTGEA